MRSPRDIIPEDELIEMLGGSEAYRDPYASVGFRNMGNYLDPGIQTNNTTFFNEKSPRQKLSGDELVNTNYSDINPWNAMSLAAPEISEGRRPFIESLLLDAGQYLNPPAKGAMVAMGPVAGMIRMGGKEFPTAKLHRAINNALEVPWWNKVMQRGYEVEKPTSLVTPSLLTTYRSNPYGILMDVLDETKIKDRMYPVDAMSYKKEFRSPRGERINNALDKLDDKDPNTALLSFLDDDTAGAVVPTPRINKARENLYRMRDNEPWLETWAPGSRTKDNTLIKTEDIYPKGSFNSIDDYLDEYRNVARGKSSKWTLGNYENTPHDSTHVLTDEILSKVTPDMISGVRLPIDTDNAVPFPSIYHALLDLAKERNLPIYRWGSDFTFGDQLKMLDNPLAGTWKKTSKGDYRPSTIDSWD